MNLTIYNLRLERLNLAVMRELCKVKNRKIIFCNIHALNPVLVENRENVFENVFNK